jgi:hypothetical protein
VIADTDQLSIQHISLDCLQVKEYQVRYVPQLLEYIQLALAHIDEYLGLIFVVPSDTQDGMYTILDGHHKFCAYVMTGRSDALCVVVEEGGKAA